MFIVGILSWWYGAGLMARLTAVRNRIDSIVDYFSIDLLLRTIFSPFKQISAGSVSGSLSQKWRAFIDRLFSRIIGAFVRILLIVIGSVGIVAATLFGLLVSIGWVLVPVLPVVGLILSLIGWTPAWM